MTLDLPDRCPADVADSLVEIGLPVSCVQAAWLEYKASVARLWLAAQIEQAQVSKENFNAVHRPIDGVGQATFRIGRRMAQVISLMSAMDAHRDERFQKKLIQDNPQFCFVPKVEQKPVFTKPASFGANTNAA
jgi:hypothetical protein